MPADFAAVHGLNRVIESADQVPIVTPLEEFEAWADDPHLDLERDTRIAERDGVPVGWARIWHRPSAIGEARAYLFGGVHPECRRQGLGSELLRWQIARARELLAGAPDGLPRFVRAQAFEFERDRLAVFARHGMRVVRYMDELLCPLADAPAPRAPEGVEIVTWDAARHEAARLVRNDAFADHWGGIPRDPETWAHDLAAYGTRLDLSFMAFDGGRLVAVCLNAVFPGDEAVRGRREGWIMNVGTVRSHRGRGVASALISHSIAAFRAHGLTHAALGVDSANPTGAYALYERLGFRRIHRSEVWEVAG